MALNPFIRNMAYFQDLRDDGKTIDAEDFDSQFDDLAVYINDKLIPAVDALVVGVVPGIQGSAGMLLVNKGALGTEWAYIDRNAVVRDGELLWQKLATATPGAILTAGADQVFGANVPASQGTVLQISRDNILKPVWQLINANNFASRAIPADKIELQTITDDNLAPGALSFTLRPNSITTRNFADGAVTTDKLGPILLSNQPNIFAPDPGIPKNQTLIGGIRLSNINSDEITPDKYLDGSIGWDNLYSGYKPTGDVFINNSLVEADIVPYLSQTTEAQLATAGTGVLIPSVLSQGFQLQGEHISDGTLDKTFFAADVQAKMTALGA